MTLRELIAKKIAERNAILAKRNENATELAELRGKDDLTEVDQERVVALRSENANYDADLDQRADEIRELQEDDRRDAEVNDRALVTVPGAALPAYDWVARVTSEERTYTPQSDRSGAMFLRDVIAGQFGYDFEARDRLARHMAEERVERAEYLKRGAVGTSAFAGLTVPQYLTDLVAPNAKAGRPLADVCRKHDLPADGMTVTLSKITTGTTADEQSSQNSGVTESSIDDTALTLDVLTVENWQSVSRQVAERSTGALDVTVDDLIRGYHTKVDSVLINNASVGLTVVANSITYTDTNPTAAELYPKLLEGLSGVEAALLDQAADGSIVVMHSRRWYWLQSQVSSTWPFLGQPGINAQQGGANYAELYGRGYRGILPNGTPVIVDNNIATTYGASTNQDEVYIVNAAECHLWEDSAAPMFIRADQAGASDLKIPLVVYGYMAFTFNRYANAMQKISGTGLVTPSFA